MRIRNDVFQSEYNESSIFERLDVRGNSALNSEQELESVTLDGRIE